MNTIKPLPRFDFAVGGQAVIEGVMMRSPSFITVAVRKPDGSITLKKENFNSLTTRLKFFGIPLLRGVVNLVEMMIVGMRMLNFSAEQSLDEESEDTSQKGKKLTSQSKETSAAEPSRFLKIGMAISFLFSLVFALGLSLFLFKFLPLYITNFLSSKYEILNTNYLIFNLIDGIIKTTFFVVYIWILGLMPNIHRVFQYHGAEHKSIYTYEKNLPLTVENAQKMTRFHPRCGTSFILVVFLLSIFIYTFVPRQPDFWMNFIVRVAFLPLVAGVSYEVLKWSAKYVDNALIKLIAWPGLMFQRITTQEPTADQLEIALTALKSALELEKNPVSLKSQLQTDVP